MSVKNTIYKIGGLICTLVLTVGISSVNSACVGWFHQPEVPTGMNRFKR